MLEEKIHTADINEGDESTDTPPTDWTDFLVLTDLPPGVKTPEVPVGYWGII